MNACDFRGIGLLGAPTGVGAGVKGTRHGPQALRANGLLERLRGAGWPVTDWGDLPTPGKISLSEDEPSTFAVKDWQQVLGWNLAVFNAVSQVLQHGQMPLLIGGDHSVAIGSVSAVAAHCRATGKRLKLVWLDAHADFNMPHTSPSGNAHGMPLACLCGLGPSALAQMAGFPQAVAPADVSLIGVRSIDAGEQRLLQQAGVHVFSMAQIRQLGMHETLRLALGDHGPDVHLHVSFDLDFLDPVLAPGVGTPVDGGPTREEAFQCVRHMAAFGQAGSIDLVEYNPAKDPGGMTARLAVELLQSLLPALSAGGIRV
ncbi:MAG TPA: arginase [Limnobacter sp.]|uniref:arginase n=1 Tax=Limnobacter sp. TaxID=2003368 RepID=UPI002E2FF3E1|nr:arginase [Limnobacter sp.]HEX5487367.1 arginase [Limnobacter sp.]